MASCAMARSASLVKLSFTRLHLEELLVLLDERVLSAG